MRVEIRARNGHLSRNLEERAERRLHFALGRFGGRIRRVVALLADLNGPRDGVDQHCRIEVRLIRSGTVMAEAVEDDIMLAVGRAAERVARRVRDALDRKRTMRARTGSPPSEHDVPPQGL